MAASPVAQAVTVSLEDLKKGTYAGLVATRQYLGTWYEF